MTFARLKNPTQLPALCPSGVLPRPYLFAVHCKAPQSEIRPKLYKELQSHPTGKTPVKNNCRRDGSGEYPVFLLTFKSSNISPMKMNFKEIGKRITGISVSIFGESWNPPESERKVAKRIMSFLEYRRVLYSPYDMEMPMYCVESIIEIRKYLND